MRHDLAKQAKAAREQVGLTQATAAKRLSTSAASLAAYEQGTRDIPDAMVDGMADLYGIHPAVFRYGKDVLREAALHETARLVRAAATELGELAALLEAPSADEALRDDLLATTLSAAHTHGLAASKTPTPPRQASK
jgi:transcriptional regulator with XRE-family HTH domain